MLQNKDDFVNRLQKESGLAVPEEFAFALLKWFQERKLCQKARMVAVAPDFRMSPEHPFPAALEDCYNIICKIVADAVKYKIDPSKIILCGDSSGANMAVSLAMMCRDRNGPVLAGQSLISPVLDFTRWSNGGDDSPLLTGGEMEYYTECYVPNGTNINHPYVSALIDGKFNDLPPAYIMGAEMDSLLIDSQTYANHLTANGIVVELVIEKGLVHSAVRARALSPQVLDAWNRFCIKTRNLAIK